MKYAWILFLFIFVFSAGADGSCLLDVSKFTKHMLDGDSSGARQMVSEMAFDPDCGCTSRDISCLRLGPEGSDTLSVNQLLEGIEALTRWESDMTDACGGLPERNEEDWIAKRTCFDRQLKEFEQKIPVISRAFFTDLAQEIYSQRTETLRNKIKEKKEAHLKAEHESLGYRNQVRITKIAEKICDLNKERKMQSERMKNVARHTGEDRNAREKRIKIEYQIKRLDLQMEKLKMEFQAVSGKSFYLFEWCEDEKQKRK